MKIYTCVGESVLAEFIPFSTPKFLFYEHMKIPDGVFAYLLKELGDLRAKVCSFFISSLEWIPVASVILLVVHLLLFQHEHILEQLDLNEFAAVSIRNKISKVHSALMFCLEELGVWLAFQVFV